MLYLHFVCSVLVEKNGLVVWASFLWGPF